MPQKAWPERCRFFDPGTSRPDRIRHLLTQDADYADYADYRLPSRLSRLVIHHGECLAHETLDSTSEIRTALGKAVPSGSTTVIYVRQTRIYVPRGTASAIALDSVIWLKVLEHFEVLTGFVELMHDISGGTLHALSQAETPENGGVDATAFHVAYKIGGWLDHENAVYARHDFVTGDTFILVVGLVTNCREKMQSLYERKPKATIFDALYS